MVGKGWVQGVALVLILGFFVMGILVYPHLHGVHAGARQGGHRQRARCCSPAPTSPAARSCYQARGLHEYGSVVGHGAYLGPDYTADYLRRATDDVADQFQAQGVGDPHSAVVRDFRANRYDPATKTLVFTEAGAAFDRITRHYAAFFGPE